MVNQTPGQTEYEFDWQNPDRKSFEVGRVVSGTFSALLAHPFKFLILTFIGSGIPMVLFSLWPIFLGVGDGINLYDSDWVDTIEWEGMLGLFGLFYLFLIFMSVFIAGALIHMSVNALNKKPVFLGEALKTGLKMFFPLLGLMFLYLLGVFVGFILFIIPGIFLMLGWVLASNIRVVEGGSVTDALSRSWEISKGYKRWILLLLIIFSVLGGVIGLVFQIPVIFFGNAQTALLEGGTMTFWIINAIASGLSQMVTAALSYVGLTATYLEVRRVREGVEADSVADIFA